MRSGKKSTIDEDGEKPELNTDIEIDEDLDDSENDSIGNMNLLTDSELDEALVVEPFSEKKSAELKLVNRYFKKILAQIEKEWVNPYPNGTGPAKLRTEIKIEIDIYGNLVDSFIQSHSGDEVFDNSILEAIRTVVRFDTSSHRSIREKYRFLRVTRSNQNEEYELMPFEAKSTLKDKE